MGSDGQLMFENFVLQDPTPYHPRRTNLLLHWTYFGRWAPLPRTRQYGGSNPSHNRIARIEPYVDEEGNVREAMSYGDNDRKLVIWYDFEEFQRAFP